MTARGLSPDLRMPSIDSEHWGPELTLHCQKAAVSRSPAGHQAVSQRDDGMRCMAVLLGGQHAELVVVGVGHDDP